MLIDRNKRTKLLFDSVVIAAVVPFCVLGNGVVLCFGKESLSGIFESVQMEHDGRSTSVRVLIERKQWLLFKNLEERKHRRVVSFYR